MGSNFFISKTNLIEEILTENLTKVLETKGIGYAIFDSLQPNITSKSVESKLEILKKYNLDFIIPYDSIYAHDCSKGIALITTTSGSIND